VAILLPVVLHRPLPFPFFIWAVDAFQFYGNRSENASSRSGAGESGISPSSGMSASPWKLGGYTKRGSGKRR
jgi:hypothetical protein